MGKASAFALARDGFQVFACGKFEAEVVATNREAADLGLAFSAEVCDAGDVKALNSFIERVAARAGKVNALVFTVGRAFSGNVETLTPESWDECMYVNLKLPFLAAKAAVPVLARSGGGTMVFIATIWAFTTPRDRAAYVAAKTGLTGLVRSLAIDHGRQNIRVNAVAPGYVETPFLLKSIEEVRGVRTVDEVIAEVEAAHPLGHMVTPDDVANTISFLSGPMSSGINGQTVVVDGGATAKFSLADAWSRPDTR